MIVYRIAKDVYAHDLSGTGARAHGGRWNKKGTSIVYTASSPALATVEFLVHVDPILQPSSLRLVSIEVPDSASASAIEPASLPEDWATYPPPGKLADIGTHWAESQRTLVLRVPSAVVVGDENVLLNPTHPEFSSVSVVKDTAYPFDPRLLDRDT